MENIKPMWLNDEWRLAFFEDGDMIASVWGSLPNNIISVDPNMEEIPTKRYTSVANAKVYIATQTPSTTNRWTIVVGWTNNESFDIDPWVSIQWLGQSTLFTGEITSATDFTSDLDEIVLRECTASNIKLDPSQFIFCYDVHITGWTFTGWQLITHSCTYEGWDFTALDNHVINSCIAMSWTFWASNAFVNSTITGNCILNGSTIVWSIVLDDVELWTGGVSINSSINTATITGNWYLVGWTFTNFSAIAWWQTLALQWVNLLTWLTVDGDLTTIGCTGQLPTVGAGTWTNSWDIFDNTASGMTATDVQWAINELASRRYTQTGVTLPVATPTTITHNLNTTRPIVAVYDNTTGITLPAVTITSTGANTISLLSVGWATIDVTILS